MQQRPAVLGILLLALLAAAALFFADRRPEAESASPSGAAAAAPAAADALGAAAAADDPFGELTREKVRPADAESSNGGAAELPPAPVHLRVQLQIRNDAGELVPPPGCRGWLIQAQTWISDTRTVSPHESYADARGIAEFVFADAVHVDWVSCQPPDARWGHSFSEQHLDISGGSREEWMLELRPAGSASGLVLDARSHPVAGAVVHAFHPTWTYGLDDWTRGFLTAASGADGRYQFPALGEGPWVFAVEPRPWLQYSPLLGGGAVGEDRVDVIAGAAAEIGVLRVVAADGIEVEVLDAAGAPVAQAHVWAQPLSFADAALGTPAIEPDAEGEDPIYERFLAGGNWEELVAPAGAPESGGAAGYWANETLSAPTDAQGRARFAMPAGLWRFGCWHELLQDGEMERATVEARVPGPRVSFRLPFRLRGYSGRLVDQNGAPPADVSLTLMREDESSSLSTQAADDGRFTFPAAPASSAWRLQAWGAESAPCTWTVDLAQDEGGVFFLPRRAPLHLQFRTADGAPLVQPNGYLTIKAMRWEMPPAPPGARVGESIWIHSDNTFTHGMQSEMRDFLLLPGSYEIALDTYAWRGQWQVWGPYYEPVRVASWVVATRPEPWVLTAEPVSVEPDEGLMARVRGVARNAATLEPLSDVQIQARRGAEILGRAQTESDGSFELLLAPGTYVLTGQGSGCLPAEMPVSLPVGDFDCEMMLRPGGVALIALLRDRDGQRLPPCEVRIYSSAQASSPHAEYWCQDGRLHLSGLPEGELIIEAEFQGVVSARGKLDVGAGAVAGEREVRLDLTRAELREQLRAQAPQPVPGEAFDPR